MRAEYPNLEMLTRGGVSGRISEWPMLKTEAAAILRERERLRREIQLVLGCGALNDPLWTAWRKGLEQALTGEELP